MDASISGKVKYSLEVAISIREGKWVLEKVTNRTTIEYTITFELQPKDTQRLLQRNQIPIDRLRMIEARRKCLRGTGDCLFR